MDPFGAGSPRARTLGAVLRDTRERLGVSQREAARRLGIANSTLGHWERGRIVPRFDSVSAVLNALDIGGEEREEILSLARGTVGADLLASGQAGVSKQLAGVMDYERTARRITEWAPLYIPGMLQIREYAQAVMKRVIPRDAEKRLVFRMARREAFRRRRNPTHVVALIGEPAIRGGIGGRDVMVDQLRELLDLTTLDTVTLQLVKVDGDWHPGLQGPFILYEFDDRTRPIVYLEHHRSGAFLVDKNDVRDYRAAIETIRRVGMSEEDSLEIIGDQIEVLEDMP